MVCVRVYYARSARKRVIKRASIWPTPVGAPEVVFVVGDVPPKWPELSHVPNNKHQRISGHHRLDRLRLDMLIMEGDGNCQVGEKVV